MEGRIEPAALPHKASIIDRHDWTETPLGDPAGWPPMLRIMAGAILPSRIPMAVLWGREAIVVCNEALLARCPDALGRPAREVLRNVDSAVEVRLASAWSANPEQIG